MSQRVVQGVGWKRKEAPEDVPHAGTSDILEQEMRQVDAGRGMD